MRTLDGCPADALVDAARDAIAASAPRHQIDTIDRMLASGLTDEAMRLINRVARKACQ